MTASPIADALYERARHVIAGGVSSDARRLPGTPLYVDRARGAELVDVDGRRFVDYVLGQGPALLGHAHPLVAEAVAAQASRGVAYAAQHALEVEVAELLCALVPSAEMVRFNSVGSEAVHGALRLARGHTGRDLVVKFEGHYHGWLDPVLYSVHPSLDAAGSADRPTLVPGTHGQTPGGDNSLRLLPWNDAEAVRAFFAAEGERVAAVICEPLLCNTGCISPEPGYLELLRELTTASGSLLVFDEIISGFRVAPGGAQELFGVTPDLATFGKAMAGGMQVSALVGSAAVMESIANGTVAHAGTFNSHPVAMAAAAAVLHHLADHRAELHPALHATGRQLMAGIGEIAAEQGIPMLVDGPGSVFQTYFTDRPAVRDYRDFAATDRDAGLRFHRALFDRGVSIVPRGLWFLSTEHGADQVDRTLTAVREVLSRW